MVEPLATACVAGPQEVAGRGGGKEEPVSHCPKIAAMNFC